MRGHNILFLSRNKKKISLNNPQYPLLSRALCISVLVLPVSCISVLVLPVSCISVLVLPVSCLCMNTMAEGTVFHMLFFI